jgi:hypothetical protein
MSSTRDGWSAAELPETTWVKSTRSGPTGGNCVEVAFLRGGVAVRDSHKPGGTALVFTAAGWDAFVSGAKDGAFG